MPNSSPFETSSFGRLDSLKWLTDRKDGILQRLPQTWTHFSNWDSMPLRWYMKVNGIDWRSDDDFAKVLALLTRINLIQLQRTPPLFRGNLLWTPEDSTKVSPHLMASN